MISARETLFRLRVKLAWSSTRRRDFYTVAAGFISDGKPIYETIQEFERRWREKGDPRADTMSSVIMAMRGAHGWRAKRLGEAMAGWVTQLEAMAIDGGEQAGDVAEGLRMAARLADNQSRIKSAINGEIIYPTFLLALFIVFMLALKMEVIPVLAGIAPRHAWPTSARLMGLFADNADVITLIIIGGVTGIATAFSSTKGRWTGSVRSVFDRFVPPWSVYRQIAGATILACFANFLKAGIPLSSVLSQLTAIAPSWERSHLESMRMRLRRGIPDGDAIAGELFDADVRWEIGVYGGMTTFHIAMSSLSERVTERVINRIQATAWLFRFITLLLIASLIVWVYGSFFQITMASRAPM